MPRGMNVKRTILAASLFFLFGCQITGRGTLYTESSIPRGSVKISKVAIVPNRLPANLTDPEKWRLFNWKIAADEFRKRGYEVVDYDTSVKSFEKSGLPVEDTHSSRDKYADLAQALAVDAIVIPYYGTQFTSKNYILVNYFGYDGVATFQVYLAERNDFASRIDAFGESSFPLGYGTLAGIGIVVIGSIAVSPALLTFSIVPILGEVVFDIFMMSKAPDQYWEQAFDKAIREGLQPFFAAFPKG
jgi:hypothetical protein